MKLTMLLHSPLAGSVTVDIFVTSYVMIYFNIQKGSRMFKGFVVLSEDEITIGLSSIQQFGDANGAINLYFGKYNRYIEICF